MKSLMRIIIWLIMLIGGVLGGLWLDKCLFSKLYGSLWYHLISFLIGALLLIVVVIISRNTGRTLAKYGRKGELPRMETNCLVKTGVYEYMRHPMHLGLLLFPFTFAFLSGSISFVIIIAPLEVVFMLMMIKFVEEPEAMAKFGDEYQIYMKTTPSFCFKKKCLQALFRKVKKDAV